ncbi:MAG TPA: hypothetical protein VJJ82_06005 [Candidatus Nanoarchaeia archaeon]|nr:hypothetical protein [Candidatus Nanoarchaeia archaeon]
MSVVGVDIDEVLAEYAQTFCSFHNKKYNTNKSMDTAQKYAFREIFGISDDEVSKKMSEFHETQEFKALPLVPGAKEGIMQLSTELIAITVRSPSIHQHTKEWLNTHFPGKIKDVKFARNIHMGEKSGKSKADFCREVDVKVMIEDSLETAKDCASKGISAILLDKPWNQGDLPLNVTRVKHWSEIPTAIKHVLK